MSVEARLRILSETVRANSSAMRTEAAVKTAIVLPFLNALGYDAFNPNEVIPEYTADFAGKKGEKVDYAVCVEGKIRIIVECKSIDTALNRFHLSQLFRYFSVTSARVALLTNGRMFNFYTDLEERNKLDMEPFLTVDITDLGEGPIIGLRQFAKDEFDVDVILETARRRRSPSVLQKRIKEIIESPSDEFIRMIGEGLYDGPRAQRPEFALMVRAAFRAVIEDAVQTRLNEVKVETRGDFGATTEDEHCLESEAKQVLGINRYPETARITLLVTENPKRPGSQAADRFARYRTGMTVGEALREGVLPKDLAWDEDHKFIRIDK